MSKVTVESLKAIKPNNDRTFKVNHPRELSTAKSLAYQTARTHPELGVKYSCKVNYDDLEITVSAMPAVETRKAKTL